MADVVTPYEVLMNSEPGQAYSEGQSRSWLGILQPVWHSESLVVIGVLCVSAFLP